MVKRLFFVAVMMMFTGPVQAEHAIDLDEGQADHAIDPKAEDAIPAPAPESAAAAPAAEGASTAPAAETASAAPTPFEEAEEPGYLLPVATREVCTSVAWGLDGTRTECRMEGLPAYAENPALRGVCITAYGRRTCY